VTSASERRSRWIAYAAAAVTIALLLMWWQGIDQRTANFLSRPVDVAADLVNWVTDVDLLTNIGVTVAEALAGLAIASVLAAILAVVLTSSRLLADIVDPFIAATNSIPKLALAPLFILVFGIGFSAKLNFVVVSVFFIPFYALFLALRTVDPSIRDHIRILGANGFRMARDLYLPAIVGAVTASMRNAVAFALVTAVVAELIAANAGIGFAISSAAQNGQPARMLSGVLVIGLIGAVLDRLLIVLERRFSRWRVAGGRTS
jgi:NitT/TauT family transport system permease protein